MSTYNYHLDPLSTGTHGRVVDKVNQSTGVIEGGLLTFINTSTITITDGKGMILSDTNPDNPVYTEVSWSGISGVTPTLTATTRTHVFIDNTGTVIYGTVLDGALLRTHIYLGYIVHSEAGVIEKLVNATRYFGQDGSGQRDLEMIMQGTILSGGNLTTTGGLGIDLDETVIYVPGGWSNSGSSDNPNFVEVAAGISTFSYLDSLGALHGSAVSAVDPALLSNATTGAVSNISSGATVQKVYADFDGEIFILIGQTNYTSVGDALQNLGDYNKTAVVPEHLKSAVHIADIVLEYNTADLTNKDRALIVSWQGKNTYLIPKLEDLSDTTITSPVVDHYLKHNGSGWVNGYVSYNDLTDVPTYATVNQAANYNWTGSHIFSNDTRWGDGFEIQLGDSADMKLLCSGTGNYIYSSLGNFVIRNWVHGGSNYLQSENSSGDNRNCVVYGGINSNVELYYDGGKKLETTTDGVDVYGYLEATNEVRSDSALRVYNSNNTAASMGFDFQSDLPRIRVGGSGNGASGEFQIQGVGDVIRMSIGTTDSYIGAARNTILHAGNVNTYAVPITGGTFTGAVTVSGSFVAGQPTFNATAAIIKSIAGTSTAMSAYLSLKDAANTERGWVGFGYGTDNFGITNTIGRITLTPEGGNPVFINGTGSTPDATTATQAKGLTIEGGNQHLVIDVSDQSNGGSYIQTRHSSSTYPAAFYALKLNPLGGHVYLGESTDHNVYVGVSAGNPQPLVFKSSTNIGKVGMKFDGGDTSAQTGDFYATHTNVDSRGGGYSFHFGSNADPTNVILDGDGAFVAPRFAVSNSVNDTISATSASNGYFYSDQAGRTAFTGGDFYIRDGVSNYFNYATNQYHGAASGDQHLFRGNTLSGNSWSLTGAGALSVANLTLSSQLLAGDHGFVKSPTARYTGNGSAVGGSGSTAYGHASLVSWDVSTGTDAPGVSDGSLLSKFWDTGTYGSQIFHAFHTNSLHFRQYNAGTWGGWERAYTDKFHPVAQMGHYRTSATRSGGRVRITLPFKTNSNKMVRFKINQYSSYTQYTYTCSGYLYSSPNNWYTPKAHFSGDGTPDIVFGRDANGYAYVSVADGNYTGISITDFTVAYTGTDTDMVTGGWTIAANDATENPSADTLYTNLHTGNYTSYSPSLTGSGASGTWGISVTGNAATATSLATSRTINGVSFNGTANITVEPYVSSDDTGDTNCPIVFSANSTAAFKRLYEDSALYFNNTANTLYSTNFYASAQVAGDYMYSHSAIGGSWDHNSHGGLLVAATATGSAYNILRVNTDNGFKLQALGGTGGTQRWYTSNSSYIQFSGTTITASLSGNATSATNADTVDSLHASSFIRSDADDNVSGHTEWQDSKEVRLGAGADMRLYHNGSTSYIDNYTGNLYMRNRLHGGDIYFQCENSAGTNYNGMRVIVGTNVAWQAYYNGSVRVLTTSAGVSVTGVLSATSDRGMKYGFTELEANLDALRDLKPFTKYTWKHSGDEGVSTIAQEWEKIHPSIVTVQELDESVADACGMEEAKVVNSQAADGALLSLCQQLLEKIDALEARIEELEG